MPSRPIVVIDPGHGGSTRVGGSSANNATGPNGLLEKDLTLDVGRRTAALLTDRAHVILTRTGDDNRSLVDRAKVAKDAGADVFLSIHFNGRASGDFDGSEAWVAREASAPSRALARAVLDRVVGVTRARDCGVQEGDLGVLLPQRQGDHTAASLLEVAFLTNPAEAERLAHDAFRDALAGAIAAGIADRLPQNGARALGDPETATPAEPVRYEPGEADTSRASEGGAGTRTGCDLVLYDFAPGDYALKPAHIAALRSFAESFALAGAAPKARVTSIRGYTDMVDGESKNVGIRDLRANAVAQWLISADGGAMPAAALANAVPTTRYTDLADLIRDNASADGRAWNRAVVVEFELVSPPVASEPPQAPPTGSTKWAIRPVAKLVIGADAAGGVFLFQLTDRSSSPHRSRPLWFVGAGLGAGEEASGGPSEGPSLTGALDDEGVEFETSRPVTFDDFDGRGGRITSAAAGLFIGVGIAYATIHGSNASPPFDVNGDAPIAIGGVEVGVEGVEASVLAGRWATTRPTTTQPGTGVAEGLSFTPAPGSGTIFLASSGGSYTDYVQPVTRGDLQPLINGRSSNPPIDRTEPLDQMQAFVATTGDGDSVYLAAWYFDPTTPLTGGPYAGLHTWGGMLAKKAAEGVKVRILQTDFDPIGGSSRGNVRAWMSIMDKYIARLPSSLQDNLQYVVSMHPATFSGVRSWWKGRSSINIGSHHQKFMVVKRGEETIAFCGGVDIESRKTPSSWSYTGLAGWHDIHVKLRGPIARDLEKEFALRWNRESGASTVAPSPSPWSGYATLPVPSAAVDGETDAKPERQQEDVQMERTVSSDATIGFTTNQDNVKQIYHNIVTVSETFLYFENQYFRSLDLADWVVAQGKANPALVAIFVVVDTPEEGNDEITEHGNYLQHEFFDRIVTALGSRAGVYTMTSRAVHSKFLLADDRYMTIGSANANERSFQLDSELNVAVDDSKLAAGFRRQLWAHNLGLSDATVGTWAVADFVARWDAVAAANEKLAAPDMAGEGIVHWDYTKHPGSSHVYVPDYLAEADPDRGDAPSGGELIAATGDGDVEDTGTAVA